MTLAEAYAACRTIARREAKNFYYAFRVLPQHKSDAMCAVYAFMRRADDISDDESLPIEQRRQAMSAWVESWRTARRTGVSDDPVFLALNDTQKCFAIPDTLLEELVQGTTMDLEPQPVAAEAVQTFATFDDLYRYCYLVASVVGLVCIRIFGYTDPRAEKLAEETGIAFQLTNILRDVKEDAERGRVYLPQDWLHEFGLSTERIQALAHGARIESADRAMLYQLGAKAEVYYASADKLLPLVDKDSRAALWVLVTIYHGLLTRIGKLDSDVFSQRASVPTSSKLLTLTQGMAMSLINRVTS
ncbi:MULTISPECIES: phytoene/squalene synthase family protein [Acidobacteriaceae]|uniref:phytoene/squalene synthase family protein n=1 Tax=Acidobacteriaceae TaxID=204434 RepID=UPI00131A8864|nr:MULTISPECIES: phytoene/squalene synthase family protein [Acidobacteriaceae]MDW5266036.1 phytoene/squalene synthase family protein [Edaphobacter sp.]